MRIDKALHALRTRRGDTYQDLAGRCVLSGPTIEAIECGGTEVQLWEAEELAAALYVPLSVLVFMAREPGEVTGISSDAQDSLAELLLDLAAAAKEEDDG